jgi:hypothetical protein
VQGLLKARKVVPQLVAQRARVYEVNVCRWLGETLSQGIDSRYLDVRGARVVGE